MTVFHAPAYLPHKMNTDRRVPASRLGAFSFSPLTFDKNSLLMAVVSRSVHQAGGPSSFLLGVRDLVFCCSLLSTRILPLSCHIFRPICSPDASYFHDWTLPPEHDFPRTPVYADRWDRAHAVKCGLTFLLRLFVAVWLRVNSRGRCSLCPSGWSHRLVRDTEDSLRPYSILKTAN